MTVQCEIIDTMNELNLNPKMDNDTETRRILIATVDILERAFTAALKNAAELRHYESSLAYFKSCLAGKHVELNAVFITRLRDTFYRFNHSYPSSFQSHVFHRQVLMDHLDRHISWLKRYEYL